MNDTIPETYVAEALNTVNGSLFNYCFGPSMRKMTWYFSGCKPNLASEFNKRI